jgi:hypothetical protein
MNDSPQNHTIFFTALVMLGVMFMGGISHFKTQERPDGLLADIAATVGQSQNPTGETTPTSTITTPFFSVSSSSVSVSPLALPYSLNASTSNETYWPKAWGNISFANNSLVLAPDPTTHGANSFLNGASSWSNYAVSANVSWLMGGWFDIVVRATNNTQNFVYCKFGPDGTGIVRRVNRADTQIAFTPASTTADVQGVTEKFGMKVYGSDIACTIANQEVVGVRVENGESHAGGIGFVIFGQPQEQKKVEVNNIHVSALSSNTIIAPFPVAPATPPAVVPASPAEAAPSTPAAVPTSVATTTKTLPYFADTFGAGDGWGSSWGTFLEATDSLTIGANDSIPSGGTLLAGTSAWDNYTFQATLDWTKGETFGMFARHTDNQNYVVCEFDERFLGDIQMRIEQFVQGNKYVLAQTDLLGYNQLGGSNITTYIQVQDAIASCSFDHHMISSNGTGNTINPPYSGSIGFTTWDPNPNNSQIVVKSVSVKSNY